MSAPRLGRNESCPRGSAKKSKHCCFREGFKGSVPQPRPAPGDGAFVTLPWQAPRTTPLRTAPQIMRDRAPISVLTYVCLEIGALSLIIFRDIYF